MPYSDHDALQKPAKQCKLWRYRSLDRLKETLERSTLHLHRIDDFEDPFEGSIPDVVARVRKQRAKPRIVRLDRAINKAIRKKTFANCWHIQQKQEASRWERYGYDNTVAIQTTFEQLTSALSRAKERVSAGKVKYIDFTSNKVDYIESQLPKNRNTTDWVMVKRQSFQFENELRILYQPDLMISDQEYEEIDYNIIVNGEKRKEPLRIGSHEGKGFLDLKSATNKGINIEIDVNELIDKIYVSPKAPDEFLREVYSAAVENGVKKNKVIKSNMASSALF